MQAVLMSKKLNVLDINRRLTVFHAGQLVDEYIYIQMNRMVLV